MNIQNIFEKKITRDIEGVIQVEDNKYIYQELDEYVVTKEILDHISQLYDNYSKGIDGYTTKVGVWISGFFGSGKSHFLKMLGYLLQNISVENEDGKKSTIEFFEKKINDPALMAEIIRISKIPTETILFNIDIKNSIGGKDKTGAVLKTFYSVFNEHRNLSKDISAAQLEKDLIKEGKYEEFKKEFESINGHSWESKRSGLSLFKKDIAKAISKVLDTPVEDAKEYIDVYIKNREISIDDFAKEVKEYIDSKEENFHLVFLADEMGQFIGTDGNLMLNIQSIVERLGSVCKGKAWVMVTSQEEIDTVCSNIKSRDFSKIQGRFDTKLSMSSGSVDEVIKKRILEKNEEAKALLKMIYNQNDATLRNLITFTNAEGLFGGYKDSVDFVETYPFIPYQIKLLQKVFEQVREHGNSGKHLSDGERSLLTAFKDTLKPYLDEETNLLMPFYVFYDVISVFLNPSIRRVIEGAYKNSELENDDFSINLLKLLYMLKYQLDSMPPTIENITTLMVDNINTDKNLLGKKIESSLRKLQNQHLIHKTDNLYIFLTNDEQDVNKEIDNEIIDEERLQKEVASYIFDRIYTDKEYRFTNTNGVVFSKDIIKRMDNRDYYTRKNAEIGISIISSLSDDYFKSDEELKMKNIGTNTVLIKLAETDGEELIKSALKIDQYVKKPSQIKLIEDKIKGPILLEKKIEMNRKRKNAEEELKQALKNAQFFFNGRELNIKGSTPKEKINQALNESCLSVYKQINYIENKVEKENEILYMLEKESDKQIDFGITNVPNTKAMESIIDFIKGEESFNKDVTVQHIVDKFTTIPFGWNSLDVSGLLATLFVNNKIEFKANTVKLNKSNKDKIYTYLTKPKEMCFLKVKIKGQIDINLVRDVRTICEDYSSEIQVGITDIEDFASELIEYFTKQIEKMDEMIDKYTNSKYPGKTIFIRGKEIFSDIIKESDVKELFIKIRDKEDELFDWKQDSECVIGFFNNQKEVFDLGISRLKKCEENESLYTQEINESIEKLKKIINNPMPYTEIPNISGLVKVINESEEKLIKDAKVKVKTQIDKDYEDMQIILDDRISDDTKNKAKKDYLDLLSTLEKSQTIMPIWACETVSKNNKRNIEVLVNNELKILDKNNAGNISIDRVTEKKRRVRKVRIGSLLGHKKLNTISDIDSYVDSLKNELYKMISEGEEIEIEG